jgi:hypothetical protein
MNATGKCFLCGWYLARTDRMDSDILDQLISQTGESIMFPIILIEATDIRHDGSAFSQNDDPLVEWAYDRFGITASLYRVSDMVEKDLLIWPEEKLRDGFVYSNGQ